MANKGAKKREAGFSPNPAPQDVQFHPETQPKDRSRPTIRAVPRPSQKDSCIIAHPPKTPKTGPIYRDTTELLQHPELGPRNSKTNCSTPEISPSTSSSSSEFWPFRVPAVVPEANRNNRSSQCPSTTAAGRGPPCPFRASCAILKLLTKKRGPEHCGKQFRARPNEKWCFSMRKFHLSISHDITISAASRNQARGSPSAPANGRKTRNCRNSKTNCYTSRTSYGTRSASFEFLPFRVTSFSPARS